MRTVSRESVTKASHPLEHDLRAAQRSRARRFYSDAYELACAGRAGEVDGRVPARAPSQERRVGATLPLYQHLLDSADPSLVPIACGPLHQLDQPLDPLPLDLFRHLIG